MPALQVSRSGHVYAAYASPKKATDNGFPMRLASRVSGPFAVRGFLPKPPSGVSALGPTKDQKQTGMCTGEGSGSQGERLYRFVYGKEPVFAPEFTYYLERQKEGTLSQGDVGAQVMTSLQIPDPLWGSPSIGWCPVDVAGYVPYDISSAPSAAQMAAAKLWPGGATHTLGNNIMNIKACIVSGYSHVIGISVYNSFEDDSVAATGLIPFPNVNGESVLGGHEMHSGIGWDDEIQCPNAPNPGAIMIQNSWGTEWGIICPLTGEKGFAWMPYDYLLNPNLASDVRMSHLGKAW